MPDPSSALPASGAPAARERLLFWSAEFADRETESRFLAHTAAATARHLRLALAIWALSSVVFVLADYANFGAGPTFGLALAGRLAMAALLVGAIWLVRRRPALASSGMVLTPLLILGFSFLFTFYFLSPPQMVDRLVAVTMVLLLAQFLFLPNRLLLGALAAVYGIVGTVASLWLAGLGSGMWLVVKAMVLTLPAGLGFFTAYRLALVHRREFAALERAEREIERRRRLEAELQRQATTDPLTGLFNRRQYEQLFQRELTRAQRHGHALSLCVLDVDHFKRVNDSFGHAAGDVALCTVADVCRAALREGDLIGRLGGEEFVMLLPHTDVAGAAVVAERLRVQLAATDVEAGPHRFGLTATLGVSELRPADAGIADLIQRADAALYSGKHGGRNRVCVAA